MFIKNVTEDIIIVNKTKKENIISQLEGFENIIKLDDSYDYLLRLPIYNLTLEKLEELREQIKTKKIELDVIKTKEINDTWEEEINNIWLKV